ncbi:MAG: hypothetical protein J6V00_10150 [Bacteroidaceae bacterium]|nr:hypothetical protein [Bacteroidaceae bacterium]
MTSYDVQVTTDLGEVVVLQICAFSAVEAEMTAISMVENGDAGVVGTSVVCCFVL